MRTIPIPDEKVLAAVDRAERHRDRTGAPVWLVFAHLGIPRRSRRVRAQLGGLVERGELRRARAHGVDLWVLTSKGRRRIAHSGEQELPESPQHLAWRNARRLAEQEIDRFRREVLEAACEVSVLLEGTASSDAWFALAERLRCRARRLGSAVYCLGEWAEPSDNRADLDDRSGPGDDGLELEELRRRRALRAGRRNPLHWDIDR